MYDILDYNNYHDIHVNVSMLDRELSKDISMIADHKNVSERLSIKVYDLEKFIKFVYAVNGKKFRVMKKEVYKVGDVCYQVIAKSNHIELHKTDKEPKLSFDDECQFIRFILGADECENSSIFPLYIDLSVADKF